MREILFRGKCKRGYDYSDGDGWVYGSLLQKGTSVAIVKTEDIDICPKTDDGYSSIDDFGCIPVEENTIGQYTGLTDKNGTKIFEGDILYTKHGVKCEGEGYYESYHEVVFKNGAFGVIGEIEGEFLSFDYLPIDNEVVCGNIYENEELLK